MDSSIAFVFITLILVFFIFNKNKSHSNKIKYIDNYNFPIDVSNRLIERYPSLSQSDIEMVLNGLKEYFKLIIISERRTIVMPSRVIDVAWHEFIINTQEYELFCKNAFERFLHHAPLKTMDDKYIASIDLKIVWKLACKKEGINPITPDKIPLIFSLDSILNIPDGFKYTLDNFENDLSFCVKNISCMGISSEYGGRAF